MRMGLRFLYQLIIMNNLNALSVRVLVWLPFFRERVYIIENERIKQQKQ